MSGVYTIHHSDISFCLVGGKMNRCVVENWYRSERFSYSDTELWRWSYLFFTFCVSKRLFLHWCVIGVLAFVPRSPAPNYVRLLRNERNIGQSIFVYMFSFFLTILGNPTISGAFKTNSTGTRCHYRFTKKSLRCALHICGYTEKFSGCFCLVLCCVGFALRDPNIPHHCRALNGPKVKIYWEKM